MRLIRDREGGRGGGGKGVWNLGKREIIYLSPHCHHQNDSCIKMGSDESHFNVSVGSDGQSHKTVHKPQPFTPRVYYTASNLSAVNCEPVWLGGKAVGW